MSTVWTHAALLLLEILLVSQIVNGLLWARKWVGLIPLMMFVGSNQYLQTILVATFAVPVVGGGAASPGSVVLFVGGLYAVLLVYVKESVSTTRSFMIGVLVANITLTMLSSFTAIQGWVGGTVNRLQMPVEVFQLNPRIFLSGTLVLILDCVLLVVLHEWGAKWAPRRRMGSIWLTLLAVSMFDTVGFTLLSFGPVALLGSGTALASKAMAATVYAALMYRPLRDVESGQTRDAWSLVAWRRRFDEQADEHEAKLRGLVDDLEDRVRERTAQLVQSEIRYRQLVDLSPEPVLVERDGVLEVCNEAALALLGMDDTGWGLEERIQVVDRPRWRLFMAGLIEGPNRLAIEMDVGGVRVATEVSGRRLPDGSDVLVVRDVSRAREVDRLKDEFLATVNHEIRTPLTSLKGSLDLMLAGVGEPSPTARDLLDIGSRNASRLLRLVNDLLDLQKIESGSMSLQCAHHPLLPLAQEAVAALMAYAATRDVDVVVEGDVGVAYVDRDRLIQVLMNLLSNAIRVSDPGGVVRVRLRAERGAILEVVDDGPGIPTEQQARVFERFAQLGEGSGGTGLGLAISRQLMAEMGGTLTVESVPGEGATFRASLL